MLAGEAPRMWRRDGEVFRRARESPTPRQRQTKGRAQPISIIWRPTPPSEGGEEGRKSLPRGRASFQSDDNPAPGSPLKSAIPGRHARGGLAGRAAAGFRKSCGRAMSPFGFGTLRHSSAHRLLSGRVAALVAAPPHSKTPPVISHGRGFGVVCEGAFLLCLAGLAATYSPRS